MRLQLISKRRTKQARACRRNADELRDFLAEPLVEELVVDGEVGRVYRSLRAAGTPLPANDIWVAATAARRVRRSSPATATLRRSGAFAH